VSSSRWRTGLVVLLLFGGLFAVVLHLGELKRVADLLRRVDPRWMACAVLLQASTYVSLAEGWRTVLRRAGFVRVRVLRLIRIALAKLFADQALPTAGLTGNVVLVSQLVSLGAPRPAAIATLLLSILGYYAAYLFFALTALFLLWVHGAATPLLAGLVTSFILVAVSVPTLALWLRRRGSRDLPHALDRCRPIRQLVEAIGEAPAALLKDRNLLCHVVFCNALVFLADAATLHACLQALGQAASFSTSMIAFMLASMVVTVGPLPFGLGSFELTCTTLLHALGVQVEAAVAATFLLRFLILWLPLIPGFLLSRQLLLHRPDVPKPPASDLN
jgi:uncharacterized protein (TIRG00374 family)